MTLAPSNRPASIATKPYSHRFQSNLAGGDIMAMNVCVRRKKEREKEEQHAQLKTEMKGLGATILTVLDMNKLERKRPQCVVQHGKWRTASNMPKLKLWKHHKNVAIDIRKTALPKQ